ncbi:MAG: dihydrodipicolinate synthase family protein, partial [Kiritimatiellae bacterium]|nr:dihydrodipicolinate synthase family protein [Kiritimatiellia bacterium]
MNAKVPEPSTPWRGIFPPMITPLLARDKLDLKGTERLIEHILAGGVHGLFILGTTGEGPSVSHRLRKRLIKRACKQVDGRVPVLVGITDTSFAESIDTARYAADCGAQAAVLAPPFYFPAGQPELFEYLTHLVPELPLPLFLYNMPSTTKLSFELETVRRASELDGVIGLKDSSSNMIYFHRLVELMKARTNFALLVGPEELLGESILIGGNGGVPGGANIYPRLFVEMYEAAAANRLDAVRDLQKKVLQLGAVYSHG